jgi:ubiquinone/menaquinone biosynthesis C-methylase UbiE
MTNTPVYDEIGKNYARYRTADPRLVNDIVDLLALPPGIIIADIGAGTGNYSGALQKRGFIVRALEPSAVMRQQVNRDTALGWITGYVENIPLKTNSVDGVIAILSLHHFDDPMRAVAEMARICNGGVLLFFTYDPRQIEKPWIADYFPRIWERHYDSFPPLSELLEETTGGNATVHPFDIPHDFEDHFFMAGWRRPEIYLDPTIRSCMSACALADQGEVDEGVERLRRDLHSGRWEEKNGWLRPVERIDLGYRFVRVGLR